VTRPSKDKVDTVKELCSRYGFEAIPGHFFFYLRPEGGRIVGKLDYLYIDWNQMEEFIAELAVREAFK
jgi:hypothetical protein